MKSNCLFEAVKAKLKDPKNITIVRIPKKYIRDAKHHHYGWIKDGTYYHASRTNKKDPFFYYEFRLKSKSLLVFQSYLFTTFSGIFRNKKDFEIIKKSTKKYNLPINGKAGFTNWVTYDKENNEGFLPTIEYFKKYYMDFRKSRTFVKIKYNGFEKIIQLKELDTFLKEKNISIFEWKFITLWDEEYIDFNTEFCTAAILGPSYFTTKEELRASLSDEKFKEALKYSHYWNECTLQEEDFWDESWFEVEEYTD